MASLISKFTSVEVRHMKKKRFPQSLRKFIRRKKARIRREFSAFKKQEELIKELYQK